MIHKKYTSFIREKAEVAEPGKRKIFGKGDRREDYEAMWSVTGNLLLAGLPGCGRQDLGRLLAERLTVSLEQAEDAASLELALSGGASVVVLQDSLFDDDALVDVISRSGKVFYLMADAGTLARRLVGGDGGRNLEVVQYEASVRLERVEPQFMKVLHFILQAQNPPEVLLEDVLEKASW